jgi:hypothetical protein
MKKVRIGNKEYSRTVIKNNILKVYNLSLESEKNDWYLEAHNFGVEVSTFMKSFRKYNITVNQVLGIVSALSPLKEWEKNKEIAVDFILTGDCGHMGANKRKARAILDCDGSDDAILEILKGPKTSRFYLNMMYPYGSGVTLYRSLYPHGGVTVDRHAIAIAIGRTATDKEQSISSSVYDFLEECYIMTSEMLGLTPLHLQSITWQAWKRIK